MDGTSKQQNLSFTRRIWGSGKTSVEMGGREVWWWCGGWSAVDATLGKESAGARKSRGKLGRGLGSKDEGKELPRIDLSERKRGWNTGRDGGKGEKRVEGVDGRLQASAKVK